jgi:restriction system protein
MADDDRKPEKRAETVFLLLSDVLQSDWAKLTSYQPPTVLLQIPHHGHFKIPKFDLVRNAAKWAELEKSLSKIIAISDNDALTTFNYDRIINRLLKEKRQKVDLSVSSVIVPERKVTEGVLVKATSLVWTTVLEELEKKNWKNVHEIPSRVWEEIIAGAFVKAGFDEVILTPRSGDHGRDVIAIRKGIGSIKILDSVKAYRPGHLVTKEELHALMGVVAVDPNASKGILTTTSDFAPRLLDDPRLAQTVPHRIELMNGTKLREWLNDLAKKK